MTMAGERVRITRWGKAHIVGPGGKKTRCGLEIKAPRRPKWKRGLCLQCRRPS